jgi:hypothetical protein
MDAQSENSLENADIRREKLTPSRLPQIRRWFPHRSRPPARGQVRKNRRLDGQSPEVLEEELARGPRLPVRV